MTGLRMPASSTSVRPEAPPRAPRCRSSPGRRCPLALELARQLSALRGRHPGDTRRHRGHATPLVLADSMPAPPRGRPASIAATAGRAPRSAPPGVRTSSWLASRMPSTASTTWETTLSVRLLAFPRCVTASARLPCPRRETLVEKASGARPSWVPAADPAVAAKVRSPHRAGCPDPLLVRHPPEA